MYGTNQLQLKWDMHVLSCECVHLRVSHVSPKLLLQPYSNYQSTFYFHIPSYSHLHMLNDVETCEEYLGYNLPCTPRIKWLNNQKNMGLNERNSFIV